MSTQVCFGLRDAKSSDFVNVEGYPLDKEILPFYNKLNESLARDGFRLRLESAFRPFERQLSIWNRKAAGELKLLDAAGLWNAPATKSG